MDSLLQVERMILDALGHPPTGDQLAACRAMVGFLYSPDPYCAFMLCGYAGTGKTSLVSALIKVAPQLDLKTQLLAPTGRAAKVLSSYSGQHACTIHKRIYATVVDSMGNYRMARMQNKASYTLYIVDEASMIGNDRMASGRSLLEDLVDYVLEGHQCRVMFIGDSAQLPPVGMDESPALDMDWLACTTPLHFQRCEMKEVVRQQSTSGILSNATAVRQAIGGDSVLGLAFRQKGFLDFCRLDGADLEEILFQLYDDYPADEVVIVTRSNKRANRFNNAIRNRILFREEEINAGDLLMVVRNNYYWADPASEMGFIANGDLVEVLSVRHYVELYGFHFVDASLRFVDYPNQPTLECKLILETLHSEAPSLTEDESHRLFANVMDDYTDIPSRRDRMVEMRRNPYYNALQVKYAYALTCHKTQGGQWAQVIVDQGFLPDAGVDHAYLRWLYTAMTRATESLYMLNFNDSFFLDE